MIWLVLVLLIVILMLLLTLALTRTSARSARIERDEAAHRAASVRAKSRRLS